MVAVNRVDLFESIEELLTGKTNQDRKEEDKKLFYQILKSYFLGERGKSSLRDLRIKDLEDPFRKVLLN